MCSATRLCDGNLQFQWLRLLWWVCRQCNDLLLHLLRLLHNPFCPPLGLVVTAERSCGVLACTPAVATAVRPRARGVSAKRGSSGCNNAAAGGAVSAGQKCSKPGGGSNRSKSIFTGRCRVITKFCARFGPVSLGSSANFLALRRFHCNHSRRDVSAKHISIDITGSPITPVESSCFEHSDCEPRETTHDRLRINGCLCKCAIPNCAHAGRWSELGCGLVPMCFGFFHCRAALSVPCVLVSAVSLSPAGPSVLPDAATKATTIAHIDTRNHDLVIKLGHGVRTPCANPCTRLAARAPTSASTSQDNKTPSTNCASWHDTTVRQCMHSNPGG